MKELTMGEERFLSESADAWKMEIYAKSEGELSDALKEKINGMAKAYVEAFTAFYKEEAAKTDERDTDVLQGAFEDKYQKEHPEFFDIDALIKEG